MTPAQQTFDLTSKLARVLGVGQIAPGTEIADGLVFVLGEVRQINCP
jgi:hypothetical protein